MAGLRTALGVTAGIVAASGGSTSAYSAAVLADSPLAYYRFGDLSGTTALDSSGNTRNGTYNAVTLGATGATPSDGDKAATFNGTSSYMRVAPTAWVPNLAGNWTVECWVNYTTTALGVILAMRADDGLDAGTSCVFLTGRTAGRVSMEVGDISIAGNRIAAAGTQNNGAWHHLAATYITSTATFAAYLDGSLITSVVRSGTTNSATLRGLNVGSNRSSSSTTLQWFAGSIDEVAVYGTNLSAGRIAAHYAAA